MCRQVTIYDPNVEIAPGAVIDPISYGPAADPQVGQRVVVKDHATHKTFEGHITQTDPARYCYTVEIEREIN